MSKVSPEGSLNNSRNSRNSRQLDDSENDESNRYNDRSDSPQEGGLSGSSIEENKQDNSFLKAENPESSISPAFDGGENSGNNNNKNDKSDSPGNHKQQISGKIPWPKGEKKSLSFKNLVSIKFWDISFKLLKLLATKIFYEWM